MSCYSKILAIIFLILPNLNFVWAQSTSVQKLAGEYRLEGVMETAAEFLIKSDMTFEYGFIYGAADKFGIGTWKLAGNRIILNSKTTRPKADFRVENSTSSGKKGISIKITDAEGRVYPYINCRLSEELVATTDNQGEVFFESTGSGTLVLYHPIFSTRLTIIQLETKHNRFIIFPTHNLADVFFKDFELQVGPSQLRSATIPGMPINETDIRKKSYVFTKQE